MRIHTHITFLHKEKVSYFIFTLLSTKACEKYILKYVNKAPKREWTSQLTTNLKSKLKAVKRDSLGEQLPCLK